MNSLHGMTHQKVLADSKWTLVEMTDQKIDEMLGILGRSSSKDVYDHYDFYYNTLTEWKNGNFKNVVDVHNRIWKWQGGTTGRATRRLTAEEEKEFVKQYYDSEESK